MSEDVGYWIATAPVGAASVLAEELAALGAVEIRERSHDVSFQGTLEAGYRACLWSRTATRVLKSLGSVPADSTEALYQAVRRRDWREHLAPGATLACDCTGGNESIRHTIYGSQLLKDAVCDSLRESTGQRPDIRPDRPDVLLHLHVEGRSAQVSLDFSGESLHRRGYRVEAGRAPVKENVAAAVLLRAGWPAVLERGGMLLDPLCGSGTFLTEGALIAADAAPALDRDYFGFLGWRGHDTALWRRLLEEARMRRAARTPRRCILGLDADPDAVRIAIANAAAAGVAGWIHVEKRMLEDGERPKSETGLLVTNPPYGERIGAGSRNRTIEGGEGVADAGARHAGGVGLGAGGDAPRSGAGDLETLYATLGRFMREQLAGWEAAVLTANAPLGKALGLHARRTHRFFNGAIECRLLRFEIDSAKTPRSPEAARAGWAERPGARMFANRLAKNRQRLGRWAAREGIECYRVYDADMPEYAFAIDIYGGPQGHVYVQEYAAPKSIALEDARARRREVLSVLPEVLEIPIERIHTRVRKPQKGDAQYEKRRPAAGVPGAARERSGPGNGALASKAHRHVVREGGLEFWVNFRDYLDTGLFLDHRLVRARLREWANGADFLNLFCYTGTATVYAAAGGARSTESVDLSHTYLDWAHDNLRLNGLHDARQSLHRSDCLAWVADQESRGPRFDLIFLDPPTFSNSKSMQGVLDVQRDHVGMIRRCMNLLRPDGRLVFSTNYRRFELDAAALEGLSIEDISAATIPVDFERDARIHRCFVLRHGA